MNPDNPEDLSLLDVCCIIEADDSISETRKRDMRRALTWFAFTDGTSLDRIRASAVAIRFVNGPLPSSPSSIRPQTWAHQITRARQALIHVGCIQAEIFRRPALTSVWWDLWSKLGSERAPRSALSPLMRHCSEHGIAPHDVTSETILDCARRIKERGSVQGVDHLKRRMCAAWRKASQMIASWPDHSLANAAPRHRSLTWSAFPPSLWEDFERWADSLVIGSGEQAQSNQRYRQLADILLRSYASKLVSQGRSPAEFPSLAALTLSSNARQWLSLRSRSGPQRQSWSAYQLLNLLLRIARYASAEPIEITRLRNMVKYCRPKGHGLGERYRRFLRPFEASDSLSRLLALPKAIYDDARGCDAGTQAAALAVQTALAIELLLFCPMPPLALQTLDVEKHFSAIDTSNGKVIRMTPSAPRQPGAPELVFELADDSIGMLMSYLETFRPRLLREPSAWLFPGASTGPKNLNLLRSQIFDAIKRRTGLHVPIGLFRHLAAFLYLKRYPTGHGVVRRVLGYRSLEQVAETYHFATRSRAVDRFDRHILPRGQPRIVTLT